LGEYKFVQNPTKISNTLHQEQSTFIVAGDIKSQGKLCRQLKCGTGLLGGLRIYKNYANPPQ